MDNSLWLKFWSWNGELDVRVIVTKNNDGGIPGLIIIIPKTSQRLCYLHTTFVIIEPIRFMVKYLSNSIRDR